MGDSLKQWFWVALHVQPRRERFVAHLLHEKGYEEFLPIHMRSRREKADKAAVPLFPGYLFCKFKPANHGSKIISTPGVIRILGEPGKPTPVPEEEIGAVRTITEYRTDCRTTDYLQVGEKVRIINGPLCGITGILTSVHNTRMLIVAVTTLRRAISVQIRANDIVAVI